MRGLSKYTAVFRITLTNHLAYVMDFLMRTFFLVLILFVFTQLWETTYSVTGKQTIEGYTLVTLLWYLVVTESIILSLPRIIEKVEQEVKNGDIAYYLNRPLHYVGYQYSGYLAQAGLRIAINLCIGGALMGLLYGELALRLDTLLPTFILFLGAFTLQFLVIMCIALLAFWMEEVRGFELIYSRLTMVLGGMMVPLEIFPDWLERIARLLPFPYVVYIPSSYAVGMNTAPFWQLFVGQWLWIGLFLGIVALIYHGGVQKVNVNGG